MGPRYRPRVRLLPTAHRVDLPAARPGAAVAGACERSVRDLGPARHRGAGDAPYARLEKGDKQGAVIRELILHNWPRTLAITGSSLLTLLMLTAAFAPV